MRKTGKKLIIGAMAVIFSTGILLSCNDGSGTTDSNDTTGMEYQQGTYVEDENMDNTSATDAGNYDNTGDNTNGTAGVEMNMNTDNTNRNRVTNQVQNGSFPADAGSTGGAGRASRNSNGRLPEDSATRKLKQHGTIQETAY